jgi:hypothetical protein
MKGIQMTSIPSKPHVERSIWIGRLPADIWAYLYDVSNETQWRAGVISAQWISDPPHGVGSEGLHIVEGVGDWPWRVTDWQVARSMSWVVTGGRLEGAHAGYRVAPEEAGSRVTMHMRVKPGVLSKVLMLIMKRRIGGMFAGDLKRLKAIMEA